MNFEKRKKLKDALTDIVKLIKSERMQFNAGQTGLQSYHARVIQSFLTMVVKNGRRSIEASKRAMERQGFSPKWGG